MTKSNSPIHTFYTRVSIAAILCICVLTSNVSALPSQTIQYQTLATRYAHNDITGSFANDELMPFHAISDELKQFYTFTHDAPLPSHFVRSLEVLREIWNNEPALLNDMNALTGRLTTPFDQGGAELHLVKQQGGKAVYFSKNEGYVIKINFEGIENEENNAEKEVLFFLLNFNLFPKNQLIAYHPDKPIAAFKNVRHKRYFPSLFEYIHTPGLSEYKIRHIYAQMGKTLADLHAKKVPAIDGLPASLQDAARAVERHMNQVSYKKGDTVYRKQTIEARCKRNRERCAFLKDAGYAIAPNVNMFETRRWKDRIIDEELCMNHGDLWPENFFIDPFSDECIAIIDAEASTVGSRSKELAKMIISTIDAIKNDPALIPLLREMLMAFFDSYYANTPLARDDIIRSLPFNMASALLWYAEGTHNTWGDNARHWVTWRLELCNWILTQETFSLDALIAFLQSSNKAISIDSITVSIDNKGRSGAAQVGDTVDCYVEVHTQYPLPVITWTSQVGVELITDAGHAHIWKTDGFCEFIGFNGHNAVFKKSLLLTMPSDKEKPFGITARVYTPDAPGFIWPDMTGSKQQPHWVSVTDPHVTPDEVRNWEQELLRPKRAVMLDFDGVILPYQGQIPPALIQELSQLHMRGIPLAVNTGRGRNDLTMVYDLFNRIHDTVVQYGGIWQPQLLHLYYNNGNNGMSYDKTRDYYAVTISRSDTQRILSEMRKAGFTDFTSDVKIGKSSIDFIFRGGINNTFFMSSLNTLLEKIDPELSQPMVAYAAETMVSIFAAAGTKQRAGIDFATRLGLSVNDVLRVGDQGSEFGIDVHMTDGPGGYSVNHYSRNAYPLSTLRHIQRGGPEALIWLLEHSTLNSSSELDLTDNELTVQHTLQSA